MILALDPGTTRTAWLLFDAERGPVNFGYEDNLRVLSRVGTTSAGTLAVEMIASYGMAVGAEVFETCVWIGRFIERYEREHGGAVRRVLRRDVKAYLCGSQRAKDANVRQALIDRFGPGKDAALGRKAAPGPLYGVSGDVWSALAVAVTASEGSPRDDRDA